MGQSATAKVYPDARRASAQVIPISPVTRIHTAPQVTPGLSTVQKWGYMFLAFAVLIGTAQGLRFGIVSGIKLSGLVKQMAVINSVQQKAITQNDMLNDKISLYSSPLGVEEMARDRLGMVAQDEVLVRLYPVALASR